MYGYRYWLGLILAGLVASSIAQELPQVAATLALQTRTMRKPKDMAVWVHPTDPDKSLILAADPLSNQIATFNLNGSDQQLVKDCKADGIDVRYRFPFNDSLIDIVAVVRRGRYGRASQLLVMTIDPTTRKLVRLDDNGILLKPGTYGGCLYHSHKTGKLHYITTSKTGNVHKVELFDNGEGRISGKLAKLEHKVLGTCRTAVADDALGRVYIVERKRGVWVFDAEPSGKAEGKLVISAGQNNLLTDVEGIAIYPGLKNTGSVVLVSEANNRFLIYDRKTIEYVAAFRIMHVLKPEGIAICAANLGLRFPNGMLVTNKMGRRQNYDALAVRWESVARSFEPKLPLNPNWNPRAPILRESANAANK